MSSYHHDTRQISKTRAKVVKPILRKFTTQSEKNSLDLDRSAHDQDGLGIYDFGATRSVHDVSFIHANHRRGYHNRSTSGTSQFSQFSTTTSGSGHRTGSFVHPFQQTPRPYTPPLNVSNSYPNSLRESEHSIRSPALAEDEEQDQSQIHLYHTANTSAHANSISSHRTPSLTGATTPSSNTAPPLRIQTKHTTTSSSRLARGSHTSLSSTLILSSPDFASPTDTMSPISGIRSSFDRNKGYRMRSHSNGVTQTVEEARRAYTERERAKDEKAARDDIKKMEKEAKKEAKQHIVVGGGHRRSSASEATRSKRSKSDLTVQYEKGIFGHEYDTATVEEPPLMGGDNIEEPRRTRTSSSAHNLKQKSNSSFHTILMWIRTRLLRMKKKTSSY